jgi:hypothetical protein
MRLNPAIAALTVAGLGACQAPPRLPEAESQPAVQQQVQAEPRHATRQEIRFRPITIEAEENGERVTRTGLQTVLSAPPHMPEETLRTIADRLFERALREKTEEANGNVAAVIFLTGRSVVDGEERQNLRPYIFLRDGRTWRRPEKPAASMP